MRHPRLTLAIGLALALPAQATNTDTDTETPTNEWALLDAELERMVDEAPPTGFDAAFGVSGFYRGNYANSQDQQLGMMGEDLGGFNTDNARLEFSGAFENLRYLINFEMFSGQADLFDGYIVAELMDNLSVTVGQFRVPFLRTALINADKLLFVARTRSSTFFAIRDDTTQGVMFEANSGPVFFQLAAQNGSDILGEDFVLTGRAYWNVAGNDPGLVEGAYGASDELSATIGVSATMEQFDTVSPTTNIERDEGLAVGVEAAIVQGPFSFQAEAADYERNYTFIGPGADGVTGVGDLRGGTTPYSVTVSFMPQRDVIEVAARHEEFDDTADRALTSFGINRYFGSGTMKLQANILHLESNFGDENTFVLGVTAGF